MTFYDSDNMSQWFIVAIWERLESLPEGDEQIDFINTIINPKGECYDGVKDFCQDAIDTSARCRRLRACQHTYHQTCIDTWFQESVHCPSCRHDIRVSATSARGQPQQQHQ
jgi:hypothetical protein